MGGILAGTDHIHNKCQYVSPHQMTNTSMKQFMNCTDQRLLLRRQMLNCLKTTFCVLKNWRLCAQGKSVQWSSIYRLKVGSFVVTDSPTHLGFLVGEPDYCKHGCVCFAISGPWPVCMAPFTSPTTGKCFCIPLCICSCFCFLELF